MATRSTISVVMPNGIVRQIYAHWDGYLSFNGKRLLECFNSAELAAELVSHGDLSVLGKYINPLGKHSFDEPEELCTVYYGRDRGETGTEAREFATIQEFESKAQWQEFDYVWRDGAWYVIDFTNGRYVRLDYAVTQDRKAALVPAE